MLFAKDDIFGKNEQGQAVENIHGIAQTLATIFARADAEDRSTAEVADQMAREKIVRERIATK